MTARIIDQRIREDYQPRRVELSETRLQQNSCLVGRPEYSIRIRDTMIGLLKTIAGFLMFVLPGAWFAFGLPLRRSSLRARFALSVVLGPLVVVPQFYLMRWAGLSFERTAYAIAIVNLPALWSIARRLRNVARPSLGAVVLWALALLVPAMYLGFWQGDPIVRSSWGHAWTHTDIIYSLANGQLRPEETLLAGFRLTYPWLAHVYEGLVSWLIGRAPTSIFLLINVVWLLATLVFVAEVVAALGGNLLAQATSVVWLCFGMDAAGLVGKRLAPPALAAVRVWGDMRLIPWLRKFGAFEQTMMGITFFAAVLYALSQSDDPSDADVSVLVTALLISSALFYPVLFPACAMLAGSRLLILAVRHVRSGAQLLTRELVWLAIAVVLSTVLLATYLFAVSIDRVGHPTMGLSAPQEVARKSVTAIVMLAPLLAGFALMGRQLWRERTDLLALLTLGAAGSVSTFIVFDIFNLANEYKFMSTAAICLTPFPVLAVEGWRDRLGRATPHVAASLAVALCASGLWSLAPADIAGAPAIDVDDFTLALRPSEPFAMAVLGVRRETPTDAVLVSRALPFDLATVTRRSMYVPYEQGELRGAGLRTDYLLKGVRDYSPSIVDRRRAAIIGLFDAPGDADRKRWIATIAGDVKRPIVVLARWNEDRMLADWLAHQPDARALAPSGEVGAWEIDGAGTLF